MIEYLESIAGVAGQITIIGTLLITVYKYLIARPAEKRKERKDKENAEALEKAITRHNEPMAHAINRLVASMDEREVHADKLDDIAESNAKILKSHESRLDSHHERLIILEVKNGIHRKVKYIEGHGGENNEKH